MNINPDSKEIEPIPIMSLQKALPRSKNRKTAMPDITTCAFRRDCTSYDWMHNKWRWSISREVKLCCKSEPTIKFTRL